LAHDGLDAQAEPMDHFQRIYQFDAARYDRMVGREDYRGALFAALNDIHPLTGAEVVEFGAGTGRLTRIASISARRVVAFDQAVPMLRVAHANLVRSGFTNWALAQADNAALPLPAGLADVAIEGWSFGHTVGWAPSQWPALIGGMLAEMRRVVRPGGTAILLETMGTGQRNPSPPNDALAAFYRWLEDEQGFAYRWIRTDYQFESVEEADDLTRYFFGDELADRIVRERITILPECTGVWFRTFSDG
jgi:ubiquinone/menaquinone biosynthesis C-methylase UbiE